MNILIAEDEAAARKNLVAILNEVEPGCTILATLESVEETMMWLLENPPPDIAFFDIQLSDDNIFERFKKMVIRFPVVFVTAYNQYAIRAFKVNSIDYILKPVGSRAVSFALNKYRELHPQSIVQEEGVLRKLWEHIHQNRKKEYRTSILLQFKDKLIPIPIDDISYFFIENGLVFCMTFDGKKYYTNKKLETIESQLDPEHFYRANRQYIISRKSIKEISPYFNERLSVKVFPQPKDAVIISKAKASDFKAWVGG